MLGGAGEGGGSRTAHDGGAVVVLTLRVKPPAGKTLTAAMINDIMRKASEGELKGILGYEKGEIPSSGNILFRRESGIFMAKHTVVDGDLVTVSFWYENEFGYTNRVHDISVEVALARRSYREQGLANLPPEKFSFDEPAPAAAGKKSRPADYVRSEEHTSELQSLAYLLFPLLL